MLLARRVRLWPFAAYNYRLWVGCGSLALGVKCCKSFCDLRCEALYSRWHSAHHDERLLLRLCLRMGKSVSSLGLLQRWHILTGSAGIGALTCNSFLSMPKKRKRHKNAEAKPKHEDGKHASSGQSSLLGFAHGFHFPS